MTKHCYCWHHSTRKYGWNLWPHDWASTLTSHTLLQDKVLGWPLGRADTFLVNCKWGQCLPSKTSLDQINRHEGQKLWSQPGAWTIWVSSWALNVITPCIRSLPGEFDYSLYLLTFFHIYRIEESKCWCCLWLCCSILLFHSVDHMRVSPGQVDLFLCSFIYWYAY